MRKTLLALIVILVSLPIFSQEIMKLSEIEVGMKGTGKTIFKGTEIESFEFKVLGILENTLGPKRHMIWVEIFSPALKDSGIAAGMSGSPMYIDGKLIGAVAFGFNFAKKPIAGLTPIEDILATSEYNKSQFDFGIDISGIKIEFNKENYRKIAGFIRDELARRSAYAPDREMSPIELIPSIRGLSPSVLSYFKPVFGFGGGSGTAQKIAKPGLKKDIFKLAPADAVAIPLVRGDFELTSSGTVTYVKGRDVYMFGHPFFNLGKVEFPMHRAEVITIFPSFAESFKITKTKNMIGTVLQDRFSAVQGVLGEGPYMIPIKVFLKDRNRTFNIETVNHRLISPALSFISLRSIFASEYREVGFQSLKLKGKIFIENERNIIIEDLFSGTEALDEAGGLILAINFFVMNNKEKEIKIQKMDFEVSGTERIQKTTIENVTLEKNGFQPGEIVNLAIHMKDERGESFVEEAGIKAPNLPPGSVFYLMVAGRDAIGQFEAKNIQAPYFPDKLNPLIRAINNLRKNSRIYLKVMTKSQGLFIKGYEYSNLPPSLQGVFVYNSQSQAQSKIKYSTLYEYQLEVPAVAEGSKLFKLKIKER